MPTLPKIFKHTTLNTLADIMKHHRTGGPDWRIYLQFDKSYLVTGPTVLWNLSLKVTVLAEYN